MNLSLTTSYVLIFFRILASLVVLILLVGDLGFRFFDNNFFKKFKKHPFTPGNYIAISMIIIFIAWPSVTEITIGNVALKKIQSQLNTVEETVNNIYSSFEREYWLNDDFSNIKAEKKEEFYHYEIILKYKPVMNSVDLWLGQDLMNPTHYTVYPDEKKIIMRHKDDPETLKNILSYTNPTITVEYVKQP